MPSLRPQLSILWFTCYHWPVTVLLFQQLSQNIQTLFLISSVVKGLRFCLPTEGCSQWHCCLHSPLPPPADPWIYCTWGTLLLWIKPVGELKLFVVFLFSLYVFFLLGIVGPMYKGKAGWVRQGGHLWCQEVSDWQEKVHNTKRLFIRTYFGWKGTVSIFVMMIQDSIVSSLMTQQPSDYFRGGRILSNSPHKDILSYDNLSYNLNFSPSPTHPQLKKQKQKPLMFHSQPWNRFLVWFQ